MSGDDPDHNKLRLGYAVETRQAEIELVWSRALYFWSFIAVLLVAYGGALHYRHHTFALLAACLGSLFSLCWTLANRGSKYWQKIWEKKTEISAEPLSLDNLFLRSENPIIEERWMLGAKQFSPSKLMIAVSDIVFVGWIVLVFGAILSRIDLSKGWFGPTFVLLANTLIVSAAICCGFAIVIWCRSGELKSWSEVKPRKDDTLRTWFRREISN